MMLAFLVFSKLAIIQFQLFFCNPNFFLDLEIVKMRICIVNGIVIISSVFITGCSRSETTTVSPVSNSEKAASLSDLFHQPLAAMRTLPLSPAILEHQEDLIADFLENSHNLPNCLATPWKLIPVTGSPDVFKVYLNSISKVPESESDVRFEYATLVIAKKDAVSNALLPLNPSIWKKHAWFPLDQLVETSACSAEEYIRSFLNSDDDFVAIGLRFFTTIVSNPRGPHMNQHFTLFESTQV